MIELLVMIAIIAFLASLISPALSRPRGNAQAIVCLNNLKQLQLAWIMYVEDNNDWLVPNNQVRIPNASGSFSSWALGDIQYGNPAGTNIDYLVGQREGSLGPHVKTHKIFKCPTDRSQTRLEDGNSYSRVRSYSMNGFMGTRVGDNGGTGAAATFLRREEFRTSGRTELLVFMDEHADSLTTCIFSLDLGYTLQSWSHWPASRHGPSGVISYTDGHAEIHRWKDPRTVKPERGVIKGFDEATGNEDWKYLWHRMSRLPAGFPDP